MSQKIKEHVQKLLTEEKIKGFLGLREENGNIMPHLFCDPKELDLLSLGDWKKAGDTRYPLNQLMIRLTTEYPEGLTVRGGRHIRSRLTSRRMSLPVW